MAKYHISKDGTPGVCHAQNGNCPLGGADQHYPTMEAAQAAADEKAMSGFVADKPKFGVTATSVGPQTDAEAIERLGYAAHEGFEEKLDKQLNEIGEQVSGVNGYEETAHALLRDKGVDLNNLPQEVQDEVAAEPNKYVDVKQEISAENYQAFAKSQYENAPGNTVEEKYKAARDSMNNGKAYDDSGRLVSVGDYEYDTQQLDPEVTSSELTESGQDIVKYAKAREANPNTKDEAISNIKESIRHDTASLTFDNTLDENQAEYGFSQRAEELRDTLEKRGVDFDGMDVDTHDDLVDELDDEPEKYLRYTFSDSKSYDDDYNTISEETFKNAPGKDLNEKYHNSVEAIRKAHTFNDEGKEVSISHLYFQGSIELLPTGSKLTDEGEKLVRDYTSQPKPPSHDSPRKQKF